MAKRAHLHDLTRQIRRYLAHQKAEGVRHYVAASDDDRADFDARRKARKERQLADLRSQITGESEDSEPMQSQTAAKQIQKESPSQFTPPSKEDSKEKTSRPSSSSAPSVSADTPLWKKHDAIHELRARKQKKARRPKESKSSNGASRTASPGSGGAAPEKPPENPQTPEEKMAFLRHYLGDCERCPLHQGRTNIVFGSGDPSARLMFVGEGPGYHEDQQGLPFVGKSGKLLTKMIGAMGLSRDEVYITNIVKCRPPDNRDPAPLEVRECAPFLKKQIEVVQPEVIVTLGRPAANTLLGMEDEALGRLRAKWHEHRGVDVMPTYHPSYLLRTEPDTTYKKRAWEDLKKVMKKLGLS